MPGDGGGLETLLVVEEDNYEQEKGRDGNRLSNNNSVPKLINEDYHIHTW